MGVALRSLPGILGKFSPLRTITPFWCVVNTDVEVPSPIGAMIIHKRANINGGELT